MIIFLINVHLLSVIISSINRRIEMKKNNSAANLSSYTKINHPLSYISMKSSRINILKSPRSTHNSNMEVIPHQESFDSILKRFILHSSNVPHKRQIETERKGLSIHAKGRTIMRQKLFKKDSTQTQRMQKNLQILKERYILLPDINLKIKKKRQIDNSMQSALLLKEDCDYEKYVRTANKMRKINKKQKKQKHLKQNKQPQGNCQNTIVN